MGEGGGGKITGKKIKIFPIKLKFHLYEVCVYSFFVALVYFILAVLTLISPTRFLASLAPRLRSLRSVGPHYLSQNGTVIQMNGVGQAW